jgi:hypothetical protein
MRNSSITLLKYLLNFFCNNVGAIYNPYNVDKKIIDTNLEDIQKNLITGDGPGKNVDINTNMKIKTKNNIKQVKNFSNDLL